MFVIMASKKSSIEKKSRGRTILYDNVPDDAYDKILDMQTTIKKKTKRAKVSISQAITKIVRNNCAE